MATQNFFALLGDDENDDPTALIARATATANAAAASAISLKKQIQVEPPAKLPTKPPPPTQSVREAENEGGKSRRGRGGGGRGNFGNRVQGGSDQVFQGDRGIQNFRNGSDYRGGGRGGGNYANGDSNNFPKGDVVEGRPPFDGGRGRSYGRGRGFPTGEEHPPFGRREYDRRSGTGRGNAIKREGSGRGNWGAEVEEPAINKEVAVTVITEEEKPTEEKPNTSDEIPEKNEDETRGNSEDKKEAPEEEDKEMTLEEYEKILMEKRKALDALKAEERKVEVDLAFKSMQLMDKKKDANEVFLKLGSDKGKKKESLEKEEKARKSVSINEFLKPVDGEGSYEQSRRRGRGDGRGGGRGDRGGFRGGFGGGYSNSRESIAAPRIEDPSQFPTLGGK